MNIIIRRLEELIVMEENILYQTYIEMFKQDAEGKYVNLIIPEKGVEGELNLIGKAPSEFTIEEIIRMKKYAAEVFKAVDKSTLE